MPPGMLTGGDGYGAGMREMVTPGDHRQADDDIASTGEKLAEEHLDGSAAEGDVEGERRMGLGLGLAPPD